MKFDEGSCSNLQLPSPPPSPPLSSNGKSSEPLASGKTDESGQLAPIDVLSHRKPADYDESRWVQILNSEGRSKDPLLLKDRMQDAMALSHLRKRGRKAKHLGTFYEIQNQHITNMLKSLEEDAMEAHEMEESQAVRVKWAVNASFAVNCILALLQIYAAVSSMSLSFFATALDAIFDPCANLALNYAHKHAAAVDFRKYPSGGARFETIGNIVYSGVMACASVVLVVESISSLAKANSTAQSLHIPALVAVLASFFAKLALFSYCWALRNKDGQVRVLWEDHRNDLLINAFGIFTNAAGAKISWWIDPLGAMIISLCLIGLWIHSISREFQFLAGKSAPVDFVQRVVYKAMTFSPYIEKIDSCKCYHYGPSYFVEIDIVMDGNTPLWLAHDLGQDLQDKLEALPNVDRAFVHLDHEVQHRPEHAKYQKFE